MTEAMGAGGATPPSGATPGPTFDTGTDDGATPGSGRHDDLGDSGKRAIAEMRKELRTRDAVVAERDALLAQRDSRIAELENAGRSELERKDAENKALRDENVELSSQRCA
jgi:hypothetical protein